MISLPMWCAGTRVVRASLMAGALAWAPAWGAADSPGISVEERLRKLEVIVGQLQDENAALRRELGRDAVVKPVAPIAPPALPQPTLRVRGDLRVRYSSTWYSAPEAPARDQLYGQMHLAFIGTPSERVEAGVRLSAGDLNTGFSGSPLSAQFAAGDNASRKYAFIDQLYLRWKPDLGPSATGAITLGKYENPFYVSSRLLFDSDIMPEGATEEVAFQFSPRDRLTVVAGQYVLDDIANSTRDPLMLAARARWEAQWSREWSSTLGAGQLAITHDSLLTAANVANNNKGNTRTTAGVLRYAYRPWLVEAAVTRSLEGVAGYPGKFPLTAGVEWLHNPGAPSQNEGWSAGLVFGKAGKAGQWEIGYRYLRIEPDAWYEEMLDGDNGAYYRSVPVGWNADTSTTGGHGGGTNVRSHALRTSYSPEDYLLFSANYFINELVQRPAGNLNDTGARRVQIEGTVRF
jgi:hypothetical protein